MGWIDFGPEAVDPVVVAVVICALFAVAITGLGIASLLPATSAQARPLWLTMATAVLIVTVGVVPVLIGGPFLTLAVAVLLIRIGYEAVMVASARMAGSDDQRRGLTLPTIAVAFGAALAGAAWLLREQDIVTTLLTGTGLAVFAIAIARTRSGGPARLVFELIAFPGIPAVAFAVCVLAGGWAGFVLLGLLLVETFDSYALLGGKLFGRRLAFPVLSPRKTVEGLTIGGAMTMATALIIGPIVFGWSVGASLIAAVLIVLAAIVGDLAGSRLKRMSGVKDFPAILPRQGGALDIVDSWLTACPVLVLAAAVLAA